MHLGLKVYKYQIMFFAAHWNYLIAAQSIFSPLSLRYNIRSASALKRASLDTAAQLMIEIYCRSIMSIRASVRDSAASKSELNLSLKSPLTFMLNAAVI